MASEDVSEVALTARPSDDAGDAADDEGQALEADSDPASSDSDGDDTGN